MYVVSFRVFRSGEEHCNVYETLAQNAFDYSNKINKIIIYRFTIVKVRNLKFIYLR